MVGPLGQISLFTSCSLSTGVGKGGRVVPAILILCVESTGTSQSQYKTIQLSLSLPIVELNKVNKIYSTTSYSWHA